MVGRVPSMNQSVTVGSPERVRRAVKAETVPACTSEALVKSFGREMIVLRGVRHDVVPDGSHSGDADQIQQRAVVAVASPDADSQVWRVAQRPVIAETVGGA